MRFDTRDIGTIVIVSCLDCGGSGGIQPGDIECDRCGGNGENVFEVDWMARLANNISIAGALGASFFRGAMFGLWEGGCRQHCDEENPSWEPGCGRSAR